ncbi:MAG: ATP-binding protein, partial [Acetobacteraceae bacterium]
FARRAELQTERVDAARLLKELREILAHSLGGGITIRVEAADGLVLSADKRQLETALINLATNARDAMPSGGTLALSAAADEIGEGANLGVRLGSGTYVRLSVADDGTGMDAAVLARASEPFFTTKPEGQGTGLGLAGARGFAEQSGGGLAIESASGRGTTVTLWFPAASDVPAAAAAERETVAAERNAAAA